MPVTARQTYTRTLERLHDRLAQRKVTVHIPEPVGLHRRRPGSHFHANPEFFLQTGGATDFACPGSRFRLNTGDVCIMPAGVPHAETPVDLKTPYGVLVVIQNKEGSLVLRGAADANRRIGSHDLVYFSGSGYAFRCLEHASHHPNIDSALRRPFLQSLAEAFLASILSELKHPGADKAPGCSPLVAEAEKLVRVEISRPDITVASVAARLGCSPDHLTRRFRSERGMTLNVWITRERIQLASELLARPGHNIAEIGWTCGFTSSSYFIRVFRTHTGLTPKAWRQKAFSAVGIRG